MTLEVRQLRADEADIVISYFHESSPEHLELLGVDPTRLPSPRTWRERIAAQSALPAEQRAAVLLLWLRNGEPVGFSSADKIEYGDHAFMHLHVLRPDDRRQGAGAICVSRSAAIYFEMLKLRALYCEPNAFNTGPNRTLQKAGFRYVKTHMTVPGPLNFRQAVTRWILSPTND